MHALMSAWGRGALLTLALLVAGSTALAAPVGQGFTYQGYLESNGVPANGNHYFEFTLYDAATGGSVVAGPTSLMTISVVDGIFTTQLDFSPATPFTGDARWLEIKVRESSSDPGDILSPRQEITAVPYALHALNASGGGGGHWKLNGSGDLYNDTAGRVGIGTTNPSSQLTVAGDGEFSDRVDAVQGVTVHDSPGAGSARASIWNADFLGAPVGGQLHTWDENGTMTSLFGSAISEGGFFSLLSADGSQGMVGNGGSTHADLGLWNDGQERTIFMTGDEGDLGSDLALHRGRTQTVELDANKTGGGYLGLRTSAGQESIALNGMYEDGSAYFVMRDGGSDRIEMWSHGGGGGALAAFRNNVGIGTVEIDAESNSSGGEIEVKKQWGQIGVGIYGDWGDGKGRIITDVLQITGGSDLSERFDIDGGAIEPGTVVSIDPAQPGGLAVSNTSYDRRVAGIVSGAGGVAPGMLMGQTGTLADGAYPVALTGRVYVKADASGGAIQPGDMLTTSELAGHAMRVDDYDRARGAILGKAMTALDAGQGLVLVLVGLQ